MSPEYDKAQVETRGARLPGYLLALMAIALLAFLGLEASQRIVSYDGAMNLQVAQNLVDGEGYTRSYHGVRPFPHEIQTNAPFIVPAAVVFALGGVGLFTAQLTNLLYLAAFCLIAGGLFTRAGRGLGWPALAVLAVLLTPGITNWGLNGFGEIPALTWWLLGTALLFPRKPEARGRAVAAVCLGLAVLTKTVMLLPVACTLAVWTLQQFVTLRGQYAEILRRTAAVALAFLAPVFAFEAWRMAGVGGIEAYQSWWAFELGHILDQAGVAPGFDDTEHPGSKVAIHFSALGAFLQLPAPLAAAWLMVPLVMVAWSLRSLNSGNRWLVAAIGLTAFAYFAWWLGITPTQKAWHRRIFNGMVLIQLLWAYTACWMFLCRERSMGFRLAGPALLAGLLIHGFSMLLAAPDGRQETRDFMAKLDLVHSLPPDAAFYGQGWHSAPRIQLYSGRTIEDINLVPFHALDDEIFLVRGKEAQDANGLQPLLSAFESMRLTSSRYLELHLLYATRSRPLVPPSGGLPGDAYVPLSVSGAIPTPSRGLSSDRWASTRVDLLLNIPADAGALEIVTASPNLAYRYGDQTVLRAYLDDCPLGEQTLTHGMENIGRFAIPPGCEPSDGAVARIRLESDNLLAIAYLKDPRQLSYMLREIRWVPTP